METSRCTLTKPHPAWRYVEINYQLVPMSNLNFSDAPAVFEKMKRYYSAWYSDGSLTWCPAEHRIKGYHKEPTYLQFCRHFGIKLELDPDDDCY